MKKIKIIIDVDVDSGAYELVYKSPKKGEKIKLEDLQEILTKIVDNWKMKNLN